MFCGRMSIRAITRLTSPGNNTVSKLLIDAGNAAACATVCLGDRRCTGYTWTGNGWRDPRSQQVNPPQCRIFTQWYAQPTGWGPDHPGQMISGVMRGAHVIADAQSAR